LIDCFDMQQIFDNQVNLDSQWDKEALGRVKEKLSRANNILIFTHKNPDTDAIGSVMTLARYLKQIGKEPKIFLSKPLAGNFFYLKEPVKVIEEKELGKDEYELIIGLDCSNLDWSGAENIFRQKKDAGVFFINIDHHPNSNYADINIVDSKSASTSLVLYKIFKIWGVKIEASLATKILAGIVADTNSFSNGATSVEAYSVAGELLAMGAQYNYVINKIQKNEHNGWFGSWARLLSRLTKNDKIKLAYSVVLPEDEQLGEGGVLDGATNFLSNLEGMRLAMVLKENDEGEIKVSLRAIERNVDVLRIAQYFGGGGHTKAAGFSVRGRLEREGNYWQVV